jgi:hypothetical protein
MLPRSSGICEEVAENGVPSTAPPQNTGGHRRFKRLKSRHLSENGRFGPTTTRCLPPRLLATVGFRQGGAVTLNLPGMGLTEWPLKQGVSS